MLHEIFPQKFDNQFKNKNPESNSVIFLFDNNRVLIKGDINCIEFPTYSDFKLVELKYTYLFSIDDNDFFIAFSDCEIKIDGMNYENISFFRNIKPKSNGFAVLTAYHLYCWYNDNTNIMLSNLVILVNLVINI